MEVTDSEVVKLLKVFTFLAEEEIKKLAEQIEKSPETREAQKVLATSLCNMVHGIEATDDAQRTSAALFSGDISTLTKIQVLEVFEDAPSSDYKEELATLDIVTLLGKTLAKSKKGEEARRLISSGVYPSTTNESLMNH